MTSVADVMTRSVRSMTHQDTVMDEQQRLVGIVSLGDISEPAEPDRSNQSKASGNAGGGSASGKARSNPT